MRPASRGGREVKPKLRAKTRQPTVYVGTSVPLESDENSRPNAPTRRTHSQVWLVACRAPSCATALHPEGSHGGRRQAHFRPSGRHSERRRICSKCTYGQACHATPSRTGSPDRRRASSSIGRGRSNLIWPHHHGAMHMPCRAC